MSTDRPSKSASPDSIGQIESKPFDAPQGADRRRHTRMYVRKSCKVFHAESRQYLPASTHDFSVGGAMVWLEPGRHLQIGDDIDIIVGWNSGAVVRQDASVPGRVLRVINMDGGRQAVAVQFKAIQQARLAA
ncbi:MAG: PilZ domain-containing protein [Phycisphaeraceae bacterium]|nr:PilZ domain-containing protein [Phycisphaeraceae bacterium]